jgi:hypothetical protein
MRVRVPVCLPAVVVVALAAVVLPAPTPVLAQGSALENVAELARMGRTEEAREALAQWWGDAADGAPRRDLQRALWLRGSLTVDPGQGALDYRRLVIEFPGGPFSDLALFRLAQWAHADGDGDAARVYVGSLVRDYPASPVRREAEAWLSAAGPARAPPAQPPEEPQPEPEVEVAPEEPEAPPSPAEETPAETPIFSVQLGAFAEEERASSLYERAVADGLDARIVRIDSTRLLHVRVGLFDTVEPARELVMRLGGRGYVAALVRDANREELIRR